MGENNISNHNFNSISPSAKSLLLMKGYTDIPYARRASELIMDPEKYVPDFEKKDLTFWARVLHFENRYWSVDQLMADLPIRNILELASGFSFRGLEAIKQKKVHYIDTDLPGIIAIKMDFFKTFIKESQAMKGHLEVLELNALDEQRFHETVDHFKKGKIVIINEGLLMYLDFKEKEKLCNIIHDILKERGGYWITADIYIENKEEKTILTVDPKTSAFYEMHHLEDNKFKSFEQAEAFFKCMGFAIDKEAEVDYSALSTMKYFRENVTANQLTAIQKAGKTRTTWRLRIAD
jgi:O-methyltransferase involved in polyketide biosynthesis